MHYSFKSTPTWTLHARPHTAGKFFQPGPAQYHVNKPMNKQASFSLVKQKRQLYKPTTDIIPGPGSYNHKSFIGQGPKRSMSARNFHKVQPTPGPSDYNNDTNKLRKTQPNFSILGKSKINTLFYQNNQTPGPTTYNSTNFLNADKNNPGTIIGHQKRKGLSDTQNTPAPNYYKSQIGNQFLNKHSPQYSMGKQGLNHSNSFKYSTPGPDQYDKKSLFDQNKSKNKGYSCKGKPSDPSAQHLSKSPGPGQYNTSMNNKFSSPRFAQTKDPRKTYIDQVSNNKKDLPGPDSVKSDFNKLSKFRCASAYNFGRSQRLPSSNNNTPGPGVYEPSKSQVFKSAPKFSIGKANESIANPEGPGPATYTPNVSLVKQSFTTHQMGKQYRPGLHNKNLFPGPASYYLMNKRDGPGWIFSKQLRSAFTDKLGDGGKYYQIPGKVPDPPTYMNVKPKIYGNFGKTSMSTNYNNSNQKQH